MRSCSFFPLPQAQYSGVLFLCEGWPLCLHDRVVVHFAPIDPSLLRPGDFYLRVAPFCDQSARILVCSLLEEEGLPVEAVEETPVPEGSYPSIFSRDWLEEINQGRRGTPLRRCLLAAEQGVVRLPWERVAVPDFVDGSARAGTSMASDSPSCLPFPPALPQAASPLRFPESSSSSASERRDNQHPPTSAAAPSARSPTALSVETRICPAKHGIAVSLCLVDANAASSSGLLRLKEMEAEPNPVGLESPDELDSCCAGTNAARKTKAAPGSRDGADKGVVGSEKVEDKARISKDLSRGGPADRAPVQGEYIDILQAAMLFGGGQPAPEEQQSLEMQKQTRRYPPQPYAQTGPPSALRGTPGPLEPDGSEPGPESAAKHSQRARPGPLPPPQRVCFSEEPCTPCTRRRQSGKVSKAQELRCRYRDSYQAAIRNPVAFEEERKKRSALAAVEEDGNPRHDNFPEPANECQGLSFNPATQRRNHLSVTEAVCEESGERSRVSYWKPAHPSVDYAYGTFHSMNGSDPPAGGGPDPSIDDAGCHRPASGSGEGSHASHARPRGPGASVWSRRDPASDGRFSSLSTAVVDTSERCELVLVEGQNVRRRENAESEIPQLHVVKCKNSTAFRLVSPKISRRTTAAPGTRGSRRTTCPVPLEPASVLKRLLPPAGAIIIDHQTQKLPQVNPPLASRTERSCQPTSASAHPRPDHLPLGAPDPRAQPLYLGVASLTGKVNNQSFLTASSSS